MDGDCVKINIRGTDEIALDKKTTALLQGGGHRNGITNFRASAVTTKTEKVRQTTPNLTAVRGVVTEKENPDELDTIVRSLGKFGAIRTGCRNSPLHPLLYACYQEVAGTLGCAVRHRFRR